MKELSLLRFTHLELNFLLAELVVCVWWRRVLIRGRTGVDSGLSIMDSCCSY